GRSRVTRAPRRMPGGPPATMPTRPAMATAAATPSRRRRRPLIPLPCIPWLRKRRSELASVLMLGSPAMTFRTLVSLVRDGRLLVLLAMTRAVRPHHRLAFLAAGASSGLFATLASGPLSLDGLADELRADPSMRDGLEAWLGLGVSLGVLRRGTQ